MLFGLEAPLWLATLAAIGPLIWLYLRPRTRPPATVSSLRLWRRAVPRAETPSRKPKLPLLFFVQVALLAACALALSRPFRWEEVPLGPPAEAILVLDVSASMQALEEGAPGLEQARRGAGARGREIAASHPTRRFTVIAAGLQPRVGGTGLDAEEAASALGALAPLDTSVNLTAAVELAATRAGSEGTVDLFTDLAETDLVVSRDARAVTRVHRFGTSDDNVAIVRLDVRANPFEEAGQARVVVTLRNTSSRERTVELELAPLEVAIVRAGAAPGGRSPENGPAGASTPAGGAAATTPLRQSVSLPPGGSEVVVFTGLPWAGPFAARLLGGDAFALDDEVYGNVPAVRPLEVLLVSDDARLRRELEALAARAGRIDLRAVPVAQWTAEPVRPITVFDRFVPPLPPSGNVLYLAPTSGNGDVVVTGTVSEVRLAEIRGHDLVRGLRGMGGLLVESMSVLAPGAGLRPVVLGRAAQREHALVLAGETGGRRVVATAFPLRADSLRQADGLSALLLTVRALRWLAPGQGDAPLERATGERLRASLRGAEPILRIEGPDGSRELSPTEEITLERAGVWRAIGAGKETPLLVSFIDPSESSIGRPPIEAMPETPRRTEKVAATSTWERHPVVVSLLLVVLGLMLGEWLLVAARSPAPPPPGPRPRAVH